MRRLWKEFQLLTAEEGLGFAVCVVTLALLGILYDRARAGLRRVARMLLILAVVALAALVSPRVHADTCWREGPDLYAGGGYVSPITVNPAWWTDVMIENHHAETALARAVAKAILRGAPIVARNGLARVYYSEQTKSVIVLLNEGRARVWKIVFRVGRRRLYFVTNYYMSGNGALRRAISRALREGAERVLPPYQEVWR